MGGMKKRVVAIAIWALGCVSGGAVHAALIVHTSDFIDDGSRSHFMDFDGGYSVHKNPLYFQQDGITIGESTGVGGSFASMNGTLTYYGRNLSANVTTGGYTIITKSDGSDFGTLGMDFSTGTGLGIDIAWAVLSHGVEVGSGLVPWRWPMIGYLGFEGVNFDEVRLKGPAISSDGQRVLGHANLSGSYQNLIMLDNIEIGSAGTSGQNPLPGQNVSEPGTLALAGLALACLAIAQRRRKSA